MTTSNRNWRWRLFLWLHLADLLRYSYLGLLGREPDAAGLEAYKAELARTRNLGELLTDIAHSDEFWEKIVAVRSPELVGAAFRGLLGREPDTEAAAGYAEVLTETKDISIVLADIVRSDEFWKKMQARRSPELVDAAFRGLLERAPDTEASVSYAEVLTDKKDISVVLEDIVRSDEFWGKMLASRSPELVDAAFRGLLGREPDTEASASYAEVLTDKKDISVILADIVRSDEFWGKMLTSRSTEIVDSTFRALLGRAPDTEASAAYAAMLAGKKAISAVLEDIIGSDEFMEKTVAGRSHQFVEEIYRCLLGRSPDQAGMARYAQVLGTTKSLGGVLSSIISSEEFAKCYERQKNWPDPEAKFEEPCLVFLHIQKTAGTSMQNHLDDCFGQKEFYREHSDSLYMFSPAELSTYDVFAGHFNYDSLRFIPRRTLSIFTFVREPRQRLISLYHFLRAHEPGHPNFVPFLLANKLMIEEFFENPQVREESRFWNHMCWAVMGQRQWREWMSLLTGEKDEIAIADILDSTIRPAIIQRLREFMFVGLQEDFDRSIQALFRLIEKQPPAKVRADHSLEKLMLTEPGFKRKMEKQPVTLRVNAALDGLIQLDNIVYEEAKKLYAERMAWLQL
jgi:hypothetical protein